MKSFSIFAFLLVVLPLHAFAGGRGHIVGGYQPIKDIKDPKVQMMGEFAVSEYNKESYMSLIFVEVVKGEKQVVAGMNYKLHVVAKEGSATKNYEAIVFVSLGEAKEQLVSFKPIATVRPPKLGGYQPIKDIKDPKVQKIGEFAVSEYNKKSYMSLKFVEVVKGEKQVVAGMNYKLQVVAKEGSATKNYEAIVFVSLGETKVQLVSFKPIATVRPPKPGGYQPIKDPKDPKVQKMGEFAVSEYNKEHNKSLKFVEVVKGETQVVAGTNYRLQVVAKEGSATKNYEAIVFVNLGDRKEELVSFEPIAAGPIPPLGGWKAIKDIKDPEVQKIGEFAVSEYNKEQKESLEFVEVVKGEQQVVSGMKYRLLVAAKKYGATKNYEAIVWVKKWENFEKLLSFKPLLG